MVASAAGEELIAQIYKKLSDAWGVAGIDRQVSFREAVFVPAFGEHTRVGASRFLGVLCYPEDRRKRNKLTDALSAKMFKSAGGPKSQERRALRQEQRIASLLDMPNKRIQQVLSHAMKRLNIRIRAGWVLSQKYVSSADPHSQAPLQEIMLRAAQQNTRQYPAFDSGEGDEEQIISSFRRRIMVPSRPVFHLAMAFYEVLLSRGEGGQGISSLVDSAEGWLADRILSCDGRGLVSQPR